MNRRSHFSIFALALCVLALFVAQTFGVKAAYYCLCSGKPVASQVSHCHGSESAKCSASETPCVGSTCNEGDGACRNHEVVKQDAPSRPVEIAPQEVVPQWLVANLPIVEVPFAAQKAKILACTCVAFEESPPFGVTVARTIVLRI